MQKAFLKSFAIDIRNQSVVIILGIEDSNSYIPIWVGNPEATAIAFGKNKVSSLRPMTHDLLMSVIDAFGGVIEKVVITGIVESTYFALIHLRTNDSLAVIDARPSDSIALAVRCDAPVFISDNVIYIDPDKDPDQDASLMERLHIINPEDLLSI